MPGEQKKVCIDVPYIDQSKLYPTGCESVSTVMLLRFLGIDITVDEFIEKYLEKKSFEERDGQVYGPDPHRYFCGSPYDDESFGCYAPVIREALEKIIGAEYTVTDETGMTTDELVEKYDCFTARRGKGFMQGLVVAGRTVSEITSKALENGLLVISAGSDVLRLVPPLVITEKDIDEMIEKLEKSL